MPLKYMGKIPNTAGHALRCALEKHALSYLLQEENQNYPQGGGFGQRLAGLHTHLRTDPATPLLGTLPKIFQQKYRRTWA